MLPGLARAAVAVLEQVGQHGREPSVGEPVPHLVVEVLADADVVQVPDRAQRGQRVEVAERGGGQDERLEPQLGRTR